MKKIQILVSIIFFPLIMSFFYGCGGGGDGDGDGNGGDNLTPTCFDRAVF
jgi:hypothetical protein